MFQFGSVSVDMIQMGLVSVKQIGNTIYIVRTKTSTTANETAYEKVRRMILEDTKKQQSIMSKTLDKSTDKSHNTVPA